MKILYLAVLLLFLTISGAAQTAAADKNRGSNVEIIEMNWRFEVRNPALDEDPMQAVNEANQMLNDREATRRGNVIRNQDNKSSQLPPVRQSVVGTLPNDPSAAYVYQLKVKNTAAKEISSISWDYVFYTAGTTDEIGRRKFTTLVTVKPDKTKKFQIRSVAPPSGTVNAAQPDKQQREKVSEKVFIRRIEYADGSSWLNSAVE